MAKGSGTTRVGRASNPRGTGGGGAQTIQRLREAQARVDAYQVKNTTERQKALSHALEEFRFTQRSSFLTASAGGGLRTGSQDLVKNERTNVYSNRWDVRLKGDTFTTTYRSDAEHSERAEHKDITEVYRWLSKRTKMK